MEFHEKILKKTIKGIVKQNGYQKIDFNHEGFAFLSKLVQIDLMAIVSDQENTLVFWSFWFFSVQESFGCLVEPSFDRLFLIIVMAIIMRSKDLGFYSDSSKLNKNKKL